MPGNKSDDLVFFDTRPGDQLFHGLSLLGWEGNMHLKDIMYPNRFKPENDTDIYTPDTYSWNEFWFTEGKNGMKELFWGPKGEHPGWVAVPLGDATYFIRWYDGEYKTMPAVVISELTPINSNRFGHGCEGLGPCENLFAAVRIVAGWLRSVKPIKSIHFIA